VYVGESFIFLKALEFGFMWLTYGS